MKNKVGFNVIFALMAFSIGLALVREFDFDNFTFNKPALGFLYLITFIACIYFMLKRKTRN